MGLFQIFVFFIRMGLPVIALVKFIFYLSGHCHVNKENAIDNFKKV